MPGTQGDTLKVVQNLPGVGALGVRLGPADRLGLVAEGDRASTSTASRSPRSITWAACARRSTPIWSGRSIWRPDPTAPSTGAGWAAWCASSSRRSRARACTATSRPTSSTPRRCCRRPLDAAPAHRRRRALQLPRRLLPAGHLGGRRRLRADPPLRRLPGARHLALGQDEELALTFLGSDDHLRRTVPSTDPAERRAQNTDASYKRLILRYTRLLPDGASFVVTPSFGYDTSATTSDFGGVPASTSRPSTWQYGLRGALPAAGGVRRRRCRSGSICR